MYQTNFKDAGKKSRDFKRPNGSNRYTDSNGSTYPYKQVSNNLYCIFCEQKGSHSSGWCKVRKHSMKFKEQKCLKHNSCFSCLKTTDHKSESCPDRRECRICKQFHHFNLHPRLDIIKYYQEKKRGPGSQ